MLQSLTKLRTLPFTTRSAVSWRWYSDDEKFEKKDKVKKEKSKKDEPVKNKESKDRLRSLLENMSSKPIKSDVKIQLAPKKKKDPKVELPPQTEEDKLKEITGKIAQKIGGNVKQTESELLTKILGLKSLKHEGTLNDLISAMKVDDDRPKPKKFEGKRQDSQDDYTTKADSVRKTLGTFRDRPRRTEQAPFSGSVNLFGGEPLGIFEKASDAKDPLDTWSKLHQRELKLAVTHPPANYFEKMIMWTEQGKVWNFPIDNEQGLEDEHATDFSEHILLEMHLDDWCPTSGPVRHFMELVCIGLSKNHWLTAQEKKDHILWYRSYFEEKKDLLGDLMLMGKELKQTQLEA